MRTICILFLILNPGLLFAQFHIEGNVDKDIKIKFENDGKRKNLRRTKDQAEKSFSLCSGSSERMSFSYGNSFELLIKFKKKIKARVYPMAYRLRLKMDMTGSLQKISFGFYDKKKMKTTINSFVFSDKDSVVEFYFLTKQDIDNFCLFKEDDVLSQKRTVVDFSLCYFSVVSCVDSVGYNMIKDGGFEYNFVLPNKILEGIRGSDTWCALYNSKIDCFDSRDINSDINRSVSLGSPDIICKYSDLIPGILPYPHSGCCYSMINAYSGKKEKNEAFGEYLQIELSSSLQKDSVYEISFWCRLAKYSSHCTNSLGVFLSECVFTMDDEYFGIHNMRSSLYMVSKDITCNVDAWKKITIEYTAKGGERYLTIGSFSPSIGGRIIVERNKDFVSYDDMKIINAYYLIDDVSMRIK